MMIFLFLNRANIADFGGDPSSVTIAGESGGGWAVCGLVLSPLARGLFSRSIQMSGSCLESLGKFLSEPEGWDIAKKVRDAVNGSNVEELRAMDMQLIAEAFTASMEFILPAIDGYVFPMGTKEMAESGNVNGESTLIGTMFRESFSEKPFNMGFSPQSLQELNEYYFEKLYDTQARYDWLGWFIYYFFCVFGGRLMKQYYPEDAESLRSKIWPYGESEFESNPASLIQTVQTTDCWVKCGSLWQADGLAANPMLSRSFPVYFYQFGYVEKPWDAVSHGYDLLPLFGEDMEWINAGKPFSDHFMRNVQRFFGGYIKGAVEAETVQSGYYVQIVDEVRMVPMNELDTVRERCEVYRAMGDAIWRDQFCMGLYMSDIDMAETMEQFGA